MKTLKQIAFLVKDRLSGGNASIDSQLDERDIMMFARAKMNEAVKLAFYENMREGDRQVVPMYIATYTDVAVSQDDKLKVYYSNLPDLFITMPYSKGVHAVHPQKDPSITFIRSNNPGVVQSLAAGNFEGKPSYYLEGLRMVYREKNFNTKWDKVIVKLLIAAPDKIGENDVLPLLPDQEAWVIEQCTQYFSAQVLQDNLNDGNKDIGVNKQ
jgi:hypothetical protein